MFHFRSFAVAAATVISLAGCATDVPLADGAVVENRNVIITNATGQTIWRFYGSRVTTSSWEEDILGSSILSNGDSVNIDFDDGTGSCMFDMKAEFRDGSSKVLNNVDVCAVTRVTFR